MDIPGGPGLYLVVYPVTPTARRLQALGRYVLLIPRLSPSARLDKLARKIPERHREPPRQSPVAADTAPRTFGSYRERLSTWLTVLVPSSAPWCAEEKMSRIVCTSYPQERLGVAQRVLYGTYTRPIFKLRRWTHQVALHASPPQEQRRTHRRRIR